MMSESACQSLRTYLATHYPTDKKYKRFRGKHVCGNCEFFDDYKLGGLGFCRNLEGNEVGLDGSRNANDKCIRKPSWGIFFVPKRCLVDEVNGGKTK